MIGPDHDSFAPRVHYPFGGRHFLCHWTNDWTKGQIILSRSQSGLEQTLKIILRDEKIEQRDFRLLNAWEINIVGIHPEWEQKIRQDSFEETCESFRSRILYELYSLLQDNYLLEKEVPSIFVKCEGDNCKSCDTNDLRKSCHYDYNITMSSSDFFNQYADLWLNKCDYLPKSSGYISKALPPQSVKNLQMATKSPFFSRGIEIDDVAIDLIRGRSVLFCFDIIKSISLDYWRQQLKELKNKYLELESQFHTNRMEQIKKKEKENLQRFLSVFK